ncbi:MAG: peptidoglycan editing factor PgeF [Eubacteriales bacterium]|nr:peptidoglycan editing factor PgeF [Eubacteriales bacterium]
MEIIWANENEHMELKTREGVPYLVFPDLEKEEGFLHGVSTRLGGVSGGHFASMNLSFTRGDESEAVWENYRRMGKAIGFSIQDLVTSDQTHTANVRVVTQEDRGKGITCQRDYHDVDGMVTNVPGLVLATYYADCVPLFFLDPVHRAVGLSHSGWRGTVGRIGAATAAKMEEVYGSRPEELIAAIGPSICQKCYEVSQDVAEAFRQAFPRRDWEAIMTKGREEGKYQLNLWEANRRVFLEAGILEKNILLPGICTCCNPRLLFSHRASKGKRGNLAAFLGIRREERSEK